MEMMGYASKKTRALFPGFAHKRMLALKGRRFYGIIMIQKQLQATLPSSNHRIPAKVFNSGANARFSLSSLTTSKGTVWNNR
jgi:hypothetical protein